MKRWNKPIVWSSILTTMLLLVGVVTYSEFVPPQKAYTTSNNVYVTHMYTDAQGMTMTYYLYVPSNYNPQKKYPLVLLLHGGGERSQASNTRAQNRTLLLNQQYVQVWSSSIQATWPSFIVIPQVMGTQRWVNVPASQGSYTLAAQPSDSLRTAKEIVDILQRQYIGIDANRLYVTGLSMGGYGTWEAIERWPHYFAAAAPLAGAGDPSQASVLIGLPIWAFHGSADTTVPVSGSRDMIQAIKAAGGNPRYTEYAGAGHGIWGTVYSTAANPDFFSWLFSQSRSTRCH